MNRLCERTVAMPALASFGGLMLLAAGCADNGAAPGTAFIGTGTPPAMPAPVVGQATLSGQVRDAAGHPVGGAVVAVAETDARVTADGNGLYRLTIPSDSTVTLVASAPGFAPTFHESVLVAAGATVGQVDFLALRVEAVDGINALVAPGEESTRGLVALHWRSVGGTCAIAGARITVWPPLAGTIVYSRASDGVTPDQPDLALTAVQPDTRVAAWLVAALPPGNGITFAVEQANCAVMRESPSLDGMVFPGQRHVAVRGLTEAELFLGQVAP